MFHLGGQQKSFPHWDGSEVGAHDVTEDFEFRKWP